jgi:hypothetical protein
MTENQNVALRLTELDEQIKELDKQKRLLIHQRTSLKRKEMIKNRQPVIVKSRECMSEGIRSVGIQKNIEGQYSNVRIVFGPHYFVNLRLNEKEEVIFGLGATHHGFKADASEVGGELETFIYEIRDAHPQNKFD